MMTSPNAYHCLKQVVPPIRGHAWHSLQTLNKKANTDCSGSPILEMPQASPGDMATGSFPLTSLSWSHSNWHTPPTNNTNKA